MNRLSFLKTLGIGVAAAVITPKILGESKHKNKILSSGYKGISYTASTAGESSIEKFDIEKPPYWDALIERYGKPMPITEFFKLLEP